MGQILSRPTAEVFTALRVSEQLRQSKRELSRSVRELDKQRLLIEAEEGKLLGEIRKLAETQKLASAKIMARDVVGLRKHQTKLYEMRSRLNTAGLQLETVKSTRTILSSINNVGRAMLRMNKQLETSAAENALNRYKREAQKFDVINHKANVVIAEATGETSDKDEAAAEALLCSIFEDLCRTRQPTHPFTTMNNTLVSYPNLKPAQQTKSSASTQHAIAVHDVSGSDVSLNQVHSLTPTPPLEHAFEYRLQSLRQ